MLELYGLSLEELREVAEANLNIIRSPSLDMTAHQQAATVIESTNAIVRLVKQSIEVHKLQQQELQARLEQEKADEDEDKDKALESLSRLRIIQ